MDRLFRRAAALGFAGFCLAAPVAAQSGFDLAPPSAAGSYLAGAEALSGMNTPEAVQYLVGAAESWDNPLILNRAFLALASNGDIDRAADYAGRLIQLDPGHEMARLVAGTEAIKQRRYEGALRVLGPMGEDSFEGITGAILRGWALVGAGRMNEARVELDKAGGGGLEEFILYHRALMSEVAGDSAAAQDYIEQSMEVDPYNSDVVESYARIFANAGRFDEALTAVVSYEAQGLSHPIITAVKEKLLANQRPGNYAASVQAGASRMFHSIGVGFAREGTSDLALVLERLAQYLDPRNELAVVVIGQIYDAAGQADLANQIYESLPATSPLKGMATVRIAANLDTLGDRTEAIRRLSNMVTSDPNNLEALAVLADFQRADKQYGESAATLTKALAVTGGTAPSDWRFYYFRGIAYERNDQFPLAEKDFLRALELHPNQPEVLNYLGYSWVDQGLHLERALGLIEQAIAGSPNDGYIIDSLGWAFYRLGRFEEAVEQLERAVQLRPNDPEINDHLGDAYWRVGRKLEAGFQWKIALAMDSEGNVRSRVEPKLAGGLDAAPVTEDSAPVEPVPDQQASAS